MLPISLCNIKYRDPFLCWKICIVYRCVNVQLMLKLVQSYVWNLYLPVIESHSIELFLFFIFYCYYIKHLFSGAIAVNRILHQLPLNVHTPSVTSGFYYIAFHTIYTKYWKILNWNTVEIISGQTMVKILGNVVVMQINYFPTKSIKWFSICLHSRSVIIYLLLFIYIFLTLDFSCV